MTRARLVLAGLLREQGIFADAMQQLDRVAEAHPNSLELLMKKGEVLQAWALKDPKHFDECVAHWTQTRLRLARLRPPPKEYYQVVYNTSFCLLEQSDRTRDPNRLRQAEQLLKTTLALEPALDSPDTVKQFQALLVRIQSQQVPAPSSPAAKTTKTSKTTNK